MIENNTLHGISFSEVSVMQLTKYETNQVTEIQKWKAEVPSVVSKALGVALAPVAWLIDKIIPEAAVRGALDFSSSAAEWLTDTKDIVRDAAVNSVVELKTHDLAKSAILANEVHNWAISIGSAEGGATGAVGLPGIAADIPAIIVLALRTIHKIGACYGFEVKTEHDKEFVYGIMSASGASDMIEKVTALTTYFVQQ